MRQALPRSLLPGDPPGSAQLRIKPQRRMQLCPRPQAEPTVPRGREPSMSTPVRLLFIFLTYSSHEASAATKSPSESSSKGFFHTRSASDQRADDDAALSHNSGRANSPKKQRTLKRTIFWPEDALFQYPASILANSDLQVILLPPFRFCSNFQVAD